MRQENLPFGADYYPNRFEQFSADQVLDCEKQTIVGLALKIVSQRVQTGNIYDNIDDVRNFVRLKSTEYQQEVFAVLFLTNRHALIAYEELFFGTVNCCSIYPREVAKRCLELNACSVVLTHNHPSGNAEPSHADIQITKTIRDILRVLDIRVLDHLIVGDSEVASMSEMGLL